MISNFSDLIDLKKEEISKEISEKSFNYLITVDRNEFKNYLIEKYFIETIIINEEHLKYFRNERNDNIEFSLPIENADNPLIQNLIILRPTSSTTNELSLTIDNGEIRTTHDPINTTSKGIARDIERVAERLLNRIARINSSINEGNKELEHEIDHLLSLHIKYAQKKIEKGEMIAQLVKIPIKKKVDPYEPPIFKKIKRKVLSKPPLPKSNYEKKEPALTPKVRGEIFDVLLRILKWFERVPRTFGDDEKLNEEDLTNIILGTLNALFEIPSYSQAFSKNGKTDILLTFDDFNVLIFECKIWGGKKAYQDVINQLFGYLTRRESQGGLILFSRNQGFSEVLEKLKKSIVKHPTYIKDSYNILIDEHQYYSKHKHPDDDKVQIELFHFPVTLFVEEK